MTLENFKDRIFARIHTVLYNNKGPRAAESLPIHPADLMQSGGKIYDCFMFFNELEILRVRLEELYDHVDHFVLVESTETHRGQPKPLYFLENQDLFKKYADKIIHVPVERIRASSSPRSWTRENFQRNQILRGLKNCQEKDLIMISDLDEIPAGADLPRLMDRLLKCTPPLLYCGHQTFRYFLNRWDHPTSPWAGTAITTYGFLRKHSPQYTRRRKEWKDFPLIASGWHFTTMGGHARVAQKYESVVLHKGDQEEFLKNYDRIDREIASHLLVTIDETFPRFIQQNQESLKEKGFVDVH